MEKAARAQSKASLSQIQMSFLGKGRMPKEERSKKGGTLRHKALNFPRKNQVHPEEVPPPDAHREELHTGATSFLLVEDWAK